MSATRWLEGPGLPQLLDVKHALYGLHNAPIPIRRLQCVVRHHLFAWC